jgi:hypothetical protein
VSPISSSNKELNLLGGNDVIAWAYRISGRFDIVRQDGSGLLMGSKVISSTRFVRTLLSVYPPVTIKKEPVKHINSMNTAFIWHRRRYFWKPKRSSLNAQRPNAFTALFV